MINPTPSTICHISLDGSSVTQLLVFFEGTIPRLGKIKLDFSTPITGGQIGRVVSLTRLKRMVILWGSPSLLIDRLLFPIGAKLTQMVGPLVRVAENYPLRFPDNLRDPSDITKIHFPVKSTNIPHAWGERNERETVYSPPGWTPRRSNG